MMHPNGFTEASRFTRFYFNNVVGNPLETTLALHYLIFDGVLERHPKLKILAVHGGGYLGAYSGRIDHAWGARRIATARCRYPPTTYLKRVYFDTVVFTPNQLAELVRTFGVDHIVSGPTIRSTWPITIRSAILRRSKVLMPRQLRRWRAATPRDCWDW